MGAPHQTAVRVSMTNDIVVQATTKGLTFGTSVITWEWLEKAKTAIFPDNVATDPKSVKKPRAKKVTPTPSA